MDHLHEWLARRQWQFKTMLLHLVPAIYFGRERNMMIVLLPFFSPKGKVFPNYFAATA